MWTRASRCDNYFLFYTNYATVSIFLVPNFTLNVVFSHFRMMQTAGTPRNKRLTDFEPL